MKNNLKSLVEALIVSGNSNSGIRFIAKSENETFISYQQLYQKALKLLSHLLELGIKVGDPLILQIEENELFVAMFWACLLGRIIPVPLSVGYTDEYRLKLIKVWQTFNHPWLICNKINVSKLEKFSLENGYENELKLLKQKVLIEEKLIFDKQPANIQYPQLKDMAFIQFSSGSTGDPKGIVLTHENLLTTIDSFIMGTHTTRKDSYLSWFPLTHDMGLIGWHLVPLVAGINQFLIPTKLFIRRPTLWIGKASEYKVSITCSPNFGLKHFLKLYSPGVAANWNLSHLRLIVNGAEPISYPLCQSFLDTLKPYGLKEEAMFPGYGLAEAALVVSIPSPGDKIKAHHLDIESLNIGCRVKNLETGHKQCVTYVDEGFPVAGMDVRICDDMGNICQENIVGHIQIRGKSVTCGYYNNDVASKALHMGEGWIQTGDIGFIRDRRLTITGRIKEMIIINGYNYFPHDIERVGEGVQGIELGGIVACGIYNNLLQQEELVLFVRFKRKLSEFISLTFKLKERILQKIGLVVSCVIPIAKVPKTTSGKIQRTLLAERYRKGEFKHTIQELDELLSFHNEKIDFLQIAPENRELVLQYFILKKVKNIIGAEDIDVNAPLVNQGLNSIMGVQLKNTIEAGCGVPINLSRFISDISIYELTRLIGSSLVDEENKKRVVQKNPLKIETEKYLPGTFIRIIPLSYGQLSLFYIYQLSPDSYAYNILFSFRICSRVNFEFLSQAFQEMINRYSILRTTYGFESDVPVQLIHENMEIKMQRRDVSQLMIEQIKERMKEYAQEPFDLIKGPVIRACLFSRELQDHFFICVQHHISGDGWSLYGFVKELLNLYHLLQKGELLSVVPLPRIQYADFVQWEQQMLADPMGVKLEEYWLQQLSGELPRFNLAMAQTGVLDHSFLGDSILWEVSPKICQQLNQLASKQGVTLFNILFSIFNLLIHRYTSQEEILVGTPTNTLMSINNSEFHQDLMGYTVNPVVIRSIIDNRQSYLSYLEFLQKKILDAIDHQAYPFYLLSQKLKLAEPASHQSLFQVMFSFLSFSDQDEGASLFIPTDSKVSIKKGHLELMPFYIPQQEGIFDISLDCLQVSESLFCKLSFKKDMIEKGFISQMVKHFSQIIHEITICPDMAIGQIDILTKAERQRLLLDFNDTLIPFPGDKTIVIYIEEQVEKTPDNTAMVYGDFKLSYQEINKRANGLLKMLVESGIKCGDIVPLLMGKSLELVIAMLGVQKMGGAFVPLDMDSPTKRIKELLDDLSAKIVLINHQSPEIVDDTLVFKYINGEQLIENSENHLKIPTLDDPIYGIYTSGSTGRPKCTINKHRGILNRFLTMNKIFGVNEKEVVIHSGNYMFDTTVYQLFWPMINGSRCVVPVMNQSFNLEYMINYIEAEQVTWVDLVPSIFNILVEYIESRSGLNRKLNSLKQLIIGGEAIEPGHVRRFQKIYPGINITNVYGPSETAIGVIFYHIPTESQQTLIPIGRPIGNVITFILDNSLKLVPIGVSGELYLGGDCLGSGYLNRPELTAEKFNFFGGDISYSFLGGRFSRKSPSFDCFLCHGIPHKRFLYRTGDIAYYLPDGSIQFIGRKDEQVKIRGVRIELGEIRHLLLNHPDIKAADVVLQEVGKSENVLVAYVISRIPQFKTDGLKNYLSQSLPGAMIPQYFILMESFPLTSTGKLNRRLFPKPGEIGLTDGKEYDKPRNYLEGKLLKIWAKLILGKSIGVEDHFFDIGGNSLKAMQLVLGIQREFRVEISVGEVFAFSTIARQARLIESKSLYSFFNIPCIEKRDYYEVSPHQKRLWILGQLQKGGVAYNMPGLFLFEGSLDINAFSKASDELMKRHESLRTFFINIRGVAWQKIKSRHEMKLELLDWRKKENSDQIFREYALKEAFTPFDLEKGPLIRLKLIRLREERFLFLFTLHHIIGDGWSIAVFFRELGIFYRQFKSGEGNEFPLLRLQYRDYSHWFKRRLLAGEFNTQCDYWKQKLSGEIPALDLPTDCPRPLVQEYNGHVITFRLNETLTSGLRNFCREYNVTNFMVWVTFIKLLLFRITGQEDIIIGTPFAGRGHTGLENQIGFYVNTIVLRNRMIGDNNFPTLLKSIKQMVIEAFENSDYPFDRIVEDLGIQWHSNRSPLFDVMVAVESASELIDVKLEGIGVTQVKNEKAKSKFDLLFNVFEGGSYFDVEIQYSCDIFNQGSIQRFWSYTELLIESTLGNPKGLAKDLNILTPVEKNQLIYEFNSNSRNYPIEDTIIDLLEQQLIKTPDGLALVVEDKNLSYSQLHEGIDQLSDGLKQKGVLTDSVVAIIRKRSIEVVVGILGVMRAGGAFLVIDPEFPKDRMDYILSDSQTSVMVTSSEIQVRLNQREKRTDGVCSSDLAYILYTSGSTGRPKGVMIERSSLMNLVFCLQQDIFNQEEGVFKVGLVASFVFDASLQQIFPALMGGHCLHIISDELKRDGFLLDSYICKREIDIIDITPSLFSILVESRLVKGGNSRLKQILIGGEALPVYLVKRFYQSSANQKIRIINLYGPTECCVDAICYGLDSKAEFRSEIVPIGVPMANTQVYILDGYFQLVPIMVSGEIYLSGEGVGRGYLNRPELTAEKFNIKKTRKNFYINQTLLWGVQGGGFLEKNPPARRRQKTYKTGDWGRWLADGNVEFLGRVDDQVKVRGYRIELKEIEYHLLMHPLIANVVVITRKIIIGSVDLVAYIQVRGDLTEQEVKSHLKKYLPVYMVPSMVVILENFPLSVGGKVDKQALLQLIEEKTERSDTAPRNLTEKRLLGLWADVLGRKKIGIFDDFFELGGQSLRATRLVIKIYQEFKVEVRLRDIFNSPTVALLAKVIDKRKFSGLELIKKVSEQSDYQVSPAQRRLWILERIRDKSAAYHIFGMFKIVGELNLKALEGALGILIERHEAFRTTFYMKEGELRQKIHPYKGFEIEKVDVKGASIGGQVQQYIKKYAFSPFNLEDGPLFRWALLETSNNHFILLLCMHHIIGDGWSSGIFVQELSIVYECHLLKRKFPLPDLPIQYRDYAEWQNRQLQVGVFNKELDYWRHQLGGELPVLELPFQKNRPQVQTFDGQSLTFILGAELTDRLKKCCIDHQMTLFMVLVAMVKVLIFRYTGAEDLMIGTPVAGRNFSPLENQIGYYVNTLVLRDYIRGENSFEEVLETVKKTIIEAYDNQNYPFDGLVEELDVLRDPSRSPLFDMMVMFQEKEQPVLNLKGVEIEPLDFDLGISKFDLTLNFIEREGYLELNIEYNRDLFQEDSFIRLWIHFQELIKNILSDSGLGIQYVNIIDEVEKNELLGFFNGGSQDFPFEESILSLIEQTNLKRPMGIALVGNGESESISGLESEKKSAHSFELFLTYEEMNLKADILARLLKVKGVDQDSIVGIMMERSVEVIIVILGILKAGGAYLPIDIETPRQRIEYILKDSHAGILIVSGGVDKGSDIPQEVGGIQWIHPFSYQEFQLKGDSKASIPGQSDFIDRYKKSQLVYVLYTSGSTGQPKGVMISHYSMMNLVCTLDRDIYGQYEGVLRVGLVASFVFDASVQQIFPSLVGGHTLYVISDKIKRDGFLLSSYIRGRGLQVIDGTPTLFRILVETGLAEAGFFRLYHILLGGEALDYELVNGFYQYESNRKINITNLYGPTECCVDTMGYKIKDRDGHATGNVPIGQPLTNTQVYIWDWNFQWVPIMITGEIYLSGHGLSRGYMNQPELTAEKFNIKKPGALFEKTAPGPRKSFYINQKLLWGVQGGGFLEKNPPAHRRYILYKTGDLGRWLPEGHIEFMGRHDGQVKIRGFRIELGEIRNQLLKHPQIAEVVVVINKINDQWEIVAGIVKTVDDDSLKIDIKEFKSYLSQFLPYYMIPSIIFYLETVPLTESGKVDQGKITQLALKHRIGLIGDNYMAPGDEIEEKLAFIWGEILGMDKIGIHDNFFELGGHSLKAAQVLSKVYRELDVNIEMRQFFFNPTIKKMATEIKNLLWIRDAQSVTTDDKENLMEIIL